MTKIVQQVRTLGSKMDERMIRFFYRHMILGFLFGIVVIPTLVTCAVALLTTIAVFPMALIFGWL